MTAFARALFAAAAIAVTLAAAASATESTIYPGVAIGKVKLGMTATQVKKALGRDYLLNVRARLPSSKRYIEYLRNYSEYSVGFTGGARPKVVIIGTALRRHKTGSGVGVGTSFEALKRKFEVVPCQWTRKLPGGGGRGSASMKICAAYLIAFWPQARVARCSCWRATGAARSVPRRGVLTLASRYSSQIPIPRSMTRLFGHPVKRVAAAILVAGVVPAAASATESTIYPGVGIGKVKLGMTLSQVKRALRGKLMLPSGRQRLSGGKQYAEYIWNYSEYRVGFVDGKAAVIGTFLRRQRVNGLGVGSDREVVKANLGAVTCRAAQQLPGAGGRYVRVLPQNDTEYGLAAVRAHGVRPVCVLGPDGRATVFYTGGENCDSITKKCEKYVVREVLVTRPYTTRSFVQAHAPWLPR